MLVGYARISTTEQRIERQLVKLNELGCEKVYVDKCSGKDTHRPKFSELMDYVREGDILIVTEWSRLSRSTMDLLTTLSELEKKGVIVKSVKENFDTSTPQGKFMLTVFAAIGQFERELILQRQAEGIAIAKKEGKYKGRKAMELDNWDEVYAAWKNDEITAVAASKLLGINRGTFYQRVKKIEGGEINGELETGRK